MYSCASQCIAGYRTELFWAVESWRGIHHCHRQIKLNGQKLPNQPYSPLASCKIEPLQKRSSSILQQTIAKIQISTWFSTTNGVNTGQAWLLVYPPTESLGGNVYCNRHVDICHNIDSAEGRLKIICGQRQQTSRRAEDVTSNPPPYICWLL